MNAFMDPPLETLGKLASIIVNTRKMFAADGIATNCVALEELLHDPDVEAFIAAGRKLAIIPKECE